MHRVAALSFLLHIYSICCDQFTQHEAELATIDMSKYDDEFISLSNTVLQGLNTYGFLSLMNVPNLSTNKLLSISEQFFQQDISYKLNYAKCKWNASNPNCYRGYYPIIPGQSSMKEAIEYGRPPSALRKSLGPDHDKFPDFSLYENNWNTHPDIESWSEIFDQQYEILLDTATKIMRLISYGLYKNTTEKPISYFEPMFLPYPLATFRLMHSPSHPLYKEMETREEKDGFCVTSTMDHMDSGFITLVITFQRGLEAYNENQERWEKLPVSRDDDIYGNNLVHINVGRLLRNMTNGELKATRHRVINYGESRYSVAFFFEPNYDTEVEISPTVFEKYGDWIVEIDKQFIEYSDEKVGLCWVNKTNNDNLECVDHENNPIDYSYDDGLYQKFIDGNKN